LLKIEQNKREKAEKEKIQRQKDAKILADIEEKRQAILNAIIKKEKEAKEKLEAEIEAKKQAELDEEILKEAKEKALLLAPDKEKLEILAEDFLRFPLPALESHSANITLKGVQILIKKISEFIKTQAETL